MFDVYELVKRDRKKEKKNKQTEITIMKISVLEIMTRLQCAKICSAAKTEATGISKWKLVRTEDGEVLKYLRSP